MASLAVSLLLFPLAAEAGTYTVTYSGGTLSNFGDKDPYIEDYAVGSGNSASSYGDRGFNTADAYGDEDAADVSGSGAITAVFTWQPDSPGDLPPSCAVVQQSSDVFAGSDGIGTGSLDDGFGDTVSVPEAGGNELTKTQYSVKTNPGSSFQVQCSPSADSGGAFADVSAGVSYTAAAYPVTLTPGGTTKDSSGNYNILVGQHCTASLSGIPAALLNNTANPPTYQWSVSGTTFQTWSADTPAVNGNAYNPDATYEVDGPGPVTNSTAGWYWNDLSDGKGKTSQETVSCTVTVTPSAGQGAAFPVTATVPVTVWTPAWTCTGTGGTMQVNTANSALYASQGHGNAATDFFLYAGPSPGSGETGGMDWYATVATPNSALFGNGSLAIAQLIIPDLSYTTTNFLSISSTRTWSQNGEEVLDAYPYPLTRGAPNYFGGDAPGIDLSSPSSITAAHVGDQFEDYLMYFAPGSVQCVPIAHFVWGTNGNASIASVAAGWASFGTGSAGAVTPGGTPTRFPPSNSFPMWTDFYGDNAGF